MENKNDNKKAEKSVWYSDKFSFFIKLNENPSGYKTRGKLPAQRYTAISQWRCAIIAYNTQYDNNIENKNDEHFSEEKKSVRLRNKKKTASTTIITLMCSNSLFITGYNTQYNNNTGEQK